MLKNLTHIFLFTHFKMCLKTFLNTRNTGAEMNKERDKQLLNGAKDGNIKKIDEVLENGANINAIDEYGWTALMWASASGHARAVEFLLNNNADMEIKNKVEGGNALLWAAWENRLGVVNILLRRGADIEARTKLGKTVLIYAAHKNQINILKLLIGHEANLEAKDCKGKTALDYAKGMKYPEMVRILEEAREMGSVPQGGRIAEPKKGEKQKGTGMKITN